MRPEKGDTWPARRPSQHNSLKIADEKKQESAAAVSISKSSLFEQANSKETTRCVGDHSGNKQQDNNKIELTRQIESILHKINREKQQLRTVIEQLTPLSRSP